MRNAVTARLAAVGAALAAMAAVPAAAGAAWGASGGGPTPYVTHYGPGGESDVNVCSYAVASGSAHCDARVRTDGASRAARPRTRSGAGQPVSPSSTVGNNGAYDPSWLNSAYNLPGLSSTAGTGETVAIVDAYDDPNAAADLASYRSAWGLPACTTSTGCFEKLNQSGVAGSYPSANSSWAGEISLDLDMVSAICPSCHIELIEAKSTSITDLGTAVNTAVGTGAVAVSNSYGSSEWSSEAGYGRSYYEHPGVAVTASAGDSGYGVQFPAADPDVTAVGGTSLYQSTDTGTRNATETVWSGTGSGCSAYEAKPSWQTDSGCAYRTVADVSAVADPNTGVWVYDTYGQSGWVIFGGTSVASPIVASVYALVASAGSSVESSFPYSTPTALNDIVSGSNGSCSVAYLCNGVTGFDGPTGLGTPNGTAAFAVPSGTTTPPPAATVPSGVTTISASGAKPKGVMVQWSAPSSNGGSAITGYELYRSTASGSETAYMSVGCTSNSCSVKDTNTTRGVTYYYEVAAINAVGSSALSPQVSARAN